MFKNKLNALWLVGILAVPAVIYGLGTLNGSASQSQFSQVAADSTSFRGLNNGLNSGLNNSLSNSTDSGRNIQTAGLGNTSSRPVLSIPGSNTTNRLGTNTNNSFSALNNTGLNNSFAANNNQNNSFAANNNQNNSFAANNNQNNSFAANNNLNNSFAANSNQNMQVLNGRNNDGLVAIYATPAAPERKQPARSQALDRMDSHTHDDDHHDAHHDDHHNDDHHDDHYETVAHHDTHEVAHGHDDHSFVVQQPLTATTAHSIVTPSGARAVNNLGLDPVVRASSDRLTGNPIYGSVHRAQEGSDEYNAYGYDSEGYDYDGYNAHGFDREGYDWQGYNIYGYDREGYDYDGYDHNGYDRTGYYGW